MTVTLERPDVGAWTGRPPGGAATLLVDDVRHHGSPGDPYAVAVVTRSLTVDVDGDGHALTFRCDSAAGRLGWHATGLGPDGQLHTIPSTPAEVAAVCLRYPEADAALCVIAGEIAHRVGRAASLEPGTSAGEVRAAVRLRQSALQALSLKRVPQRPLREAFLTAHHTRGVTAGEVARRIGWRWGESPSGDGTRLLRRLGLADDGVERHRSERYRTASDGERAVMDAVGALSATMAYETAVAICRGLGLDPSTFSWL